MELDSIQIQWSLSSLSRPAGWWGWCCVMYTVQSASTYTGTWGEARQTTCRDHHHPAVRPARPPPTSIQAQKAAIYIYTFTMSLHNSHRLFSLTRCSPGQSLTSGEVSAEIQLSQSSKHSLSLQQTRTHVSLY